MLVAVNYHYVRPSFDQPHDGVHGLTPDQFQRQLETLSRTATFVGLNDVRQALSGSPLPERSLLVTFDDGLREQLEHAWPVLNRMGIPAAFFVNTAPILDRRVLTVHKIHLLRAYVEPRALLALLEDEASEAGIPITCSWDPSVADQYPYDSQEAASLKYLLNFKLTWSDREVLVNACFGQVFPDEAAISESLYLGRAQMGELAERGCLGSHAHDHLPLGLLPKPMIQSQVQTASDLLETWTGTRPFALSYPYGPKEACTAEAARAAAEAGVEFAFTMERAGNAHLERPLHLARFDCNDVPGGKACSLSSDAFWYSLPQRDWYTD